VVALVELTFPRVVRAAVRVVRRRELTAGFYEFVALVVVEVGVRTSIMVDALTCRRLAQLHFLLRLFNC